MIILHRMVSNYANTVFYFRLLCLPFLLLNRLEFVFQFCPCCFGLRWSNVYLLILSICQFNQYNYKYWDGSAVYWYFPFVFPFISLFCLYICCFVLRRNEVCLRPRRQSLWLRPKATPIVPIPPYIPLELFFHILVFVFGSLYIFFCIYILLKPNSTLHPIPVPP